MKRTSPETKTLGELVGKMIQLYIDNREAISNKDENNDSYREYVGCVRLIDSYANSFYQGISNAVVKASHGPKVIGPGNRPRGPRSGL